MDVLIIHGNYPAQFRQQAAALAADPSHRVVYATERQPVPAAEIYPGLQLVHYKAAEPSQLTTHPALATSEEALLLGREVLRCLHALQRQGFQPRLVLFHAGRGLGLFLRHALPEAVLVAYCEWYFKPADLPWLKGVTGLQHSLSIVQRNAPLLQELVEADLAVAPTAWQRQQFPPALRSQLQVVFDGINTSYFQPASAPAHQEPLTLMPEDSEAELVIPPGDPLLTYTTRGMEPLRGFPEFMRALPALLAGMPRLQVVVAGRDRQAYSYPAPSHGGSWKQHLLAELGDFPGRDRLHFTGLVPYERLRALMQRTDLHVYFSRPYVTSWSLFEAAACGAPIAMNQGPATTGVLPDAAFATLDLDAPGGVAPALLAALERSLQRRDQPRQSLLPRDLDLVVCQRRWQELVNGALQARRRPAGVDADTASTP